MSIVTEAQVQQWLERTKLTIDIVEEELEATAKSIVFGHLANSYDITSWTDEASTPALVQEVMSMYIAAWIYARAYSEDGTSANSYSKWLEAKAAALLSSISGGTTDLPEVDGFVSTSTPSFYPNDSSIDNTTGELLVPKFTMDSQF